MMTHETGNAVDTPDRSEPAVRCAACASPVTAQSARQSHVAGSSHINYTLYYCPACALGFWWPLQADQSIYADEGFEAYKDYHSGTRPFPRWAEPLFGLLPELRGKALDIGCGDGAVLHRLAEAGFEPYGIDLDQKSIAIARSKFSLQNVAVSTLEEWATRCKQEGRQFDLITFFEVLEHQDSPRDFLSQVTQLGKPGGMIAGSVPNRDRFLARLDRKMSDGDLPPHHFLWFSAQALKGLLDRAGFREIETQYTGALPYRVVVEKLVSAAKRATARRPATRWLLLPTLIVAAPFAAAAIWLGRKVSPPQLFFRCRIPLNG